MTVAAISLRGWGVADDEKILRWLQLAYSTAFSFFHSNGSLYQWLGLSTTLNGAPIRFHMQISVIGYGAVT